jgi:glycopeptide antibiotics resistance protein
MNLQRVWWALGALLVGAAVFVCLVPAPDIPVTFDWGDKTFHMVGHGMLALYFAGLMPRNHWWKIFAFLLLLGIGIEIAQAYMAVGRHGDPRDVLANSIGAVLGLSAARMGLSRWPDLAAWLLGRRAVQ